MKVGDLTLKASPFERPDVVDVFGETFLNSGFAISLPVSMMDGVSEILVFALTSDGTTSFAPITVQVEP